MRITVFESGLLSVLAGVCLAGTGVAEPSVGDRAPDFSMRGSDGRDYTLEQYRGKQAVVLAWFPKAFTPG